jgi:fatty acid desaturase
MGKEAVRAVTIIFFQWACFNSTWHSIIDAGWAKHNQMTNFRAPRIEWQTLALICGVYFTLILLVWFHKSIAWWVILPVGATAACLHSSLQHEVLHGHPTRSRLINEALVFITPHMWLPYGRYRDLHLQHHNDANLTCPVRDPESYYLLPDAWRAMPGFKRVLYTFNNTLFGRMLIGPAVGIMRFWADELLQMFRGRRDIIRCWSGFIVSCVIVVSFVRWAGMPLWQYVVLIAYPGISLALVRSFCEHQAAKDVGERTISVEASSFWSLLFLNNNLHVAHHDRPALAWYHLPAYYAAERDRLLNRNKHYLMQGYGEIFGRYFFSPKEEVKYPDIEWLK